MANFSTYLDPELRRFIAAQKIFFTASATADSRINLSPKGMDTFRCFSETRVGYLDFTGSGNETAAHLASGGRLTIMFCSFAKRPLILRLYGRGRVIRPRDELWHDYAGHFTLKAGARQIIVLDIESLQTSCGYSLPFMEFKGERDLLIQWSEKQGQQGIEDYWRDNNQQSIDGLPTYLLQDD